LAQARQQSIDFGKDAVRTRSHVADSIPQYFQLANAVDHSSRKRGHRGVHAARSAPLGSGGTSNPADLGDMTAFTSTLNRSMDKNSIHMLRADSYRRQPWRENVLQDQEPFLTKMRFKLGGAGWQNLAHT
jgi:hypothetical protein